MPICYCARRPTLDKPLTIQSDRTLLLDVHSPSASECRSDISKFADLIKSPEHIHTYMISQLSLWNAISTGMSGQEIIHILEKWSRYDIDSRVTFFIEDQSSRYGDFILDPGVAQAEIHRDFPVAGKTGRPAHPWQKP